MIKKFYIVSCAALVAASLAVTATHATPARARVNDTTRLVVDEAVVPIGELKLSTVKLVRERVEPNPAEFTRMAGRRTTKRHLRTSAPRRANKKRQHGSAFKVFTLSAPLTSTGSDGHLQPDGYGVPVLGW